MTFLNSLAKVHNKTRTENGAVAYKSTLNANLDLFALAGAMRDRKEEAVRLWRLAYAENPLLAIRCMFYLRDVRGGQGERELFRSMMRELFNIDRDVGLKVLGFISQYGRWDDLFECGANVNDYVSLISSQLDADQEAMGRNKPVSLLAKWIQKNI